MLHCIRQAKEGGENIFSDGFAAALEMEVHHKADFDVLCNTPVYWVDVGVQDDRYHEMRTKRPIFECEQYSKLYQHYFFRLMKRN